MGFQSQALSEVEGPMIGKADTERRRPTYEARNDNPILCEATSTMKMSAMRQHADLQYTLLPVVA
jgi:hypothetical protein